MFKLNQARSEGWSLALDPIRIISIDPDNTDLSMRSYVLGQVLAGSAYHIEAFQIVTAQNKDAIALVPEVSINGYAKIKASVVVEVTETEDYDNPDFSEHDAGTPAMLQRTVTREVTKPAGSVAKVIRRGSNPTSITLEFPGGGDATYDENDDDWFPFEAIQAMSVVGNYGVLTVDQKTGAVLDYKPRDEDEPEYGDIALVDVAELRSTFGELPDYIDIVLVGFTTKDGTREAPDRDDWLRVRLDDPQVIDPTLAAVIRARCGLQA